MKDRQKIIVFSAVFLILYLILVALTYFVLWQHTNVIFMLKNQIFDITGHYPQIYTSELIEIVWAAFYVTVPVVFVILMFNVLKIMKKTNTT